MVEEVEGVDEPNHPADRQDGVQYGVVGEVEPETECGQSDGDKRLRHELGGWTQVPQVVEQAEREDGCAACKHRPRRRRGWCPHDGRDRHRYKNRRPTEQRHRGSVPAGRARGVDDRQAEGETPAHPGEDCRQQHGQHTCANQAGHHSHHRYAERVCCRYSRSSCCASAW